jgi:hypothetical protein
MLRQLSKQRIEIQISFAYQVAASQFSGVFLRNSCSHLLAWSFRGEQCLIRGHQSCSLFCSSDVASPGRSHQIRGSPLSTTYPRRSSDCACSIQRVAHPVYCPKRCGSVLFLCLSAEHNSGPPRMTRDNYKAKK